MNRWAGLSIALFLLLHCLGCGGTSNTTTTTQTTTTGQAAAPVVTITPTATATPTPTPTPSAINLGPSILIANRTGGTVSVIDVATDAVTQTITLPDVPFPAQASYVSVSAARNQIYVGDDANSRIRVYDATNLSLLNTFVMGRDVFHMWNNDVQLWAVDRRAKVLSVFNLVAGTKIADVPIPADLSAAGGEPHDVVVDGTAAYVTISQVAAAPDVVVRFSTTTLLETGRAPVGEDPHVILHPTDNRLFVACQDTDNLFIIDKTTMAQTNLIPLLGGHGVWIPPAGDALYVTNFPSHVTPGTPGPGANGLFTVNTALEMESGSIPTSSAPHNVVTTPDGNKLYLTHSNGGTTVTVFDTSAPDRLPRNPRAITAGANPFGIAFLP